MNSLGECLQTYGVRWSQIIRRFIMGLLAAGMGIFMFAGRDYLKGENQLLILVAIPLFIGIFVFGLWLLGTAVMTVVKNPRICLYKDGVGVLTRFGEQHWRWDEFTMAKGWMTRHLLYGVSFLEIVTVGAYDFYQDERKLFTITPMQRHAGELMTILEEQIVTAILPRTLRAFQNGESLSFGPIQLDQQGIHRGKFHAEWLSVQRFTYDQHWLQIFCDGKRKPVNWQFMEISNRLLLINVLDRVLKSRGSGVS